LPQDCRPLKPLRASPLTRRRLPARVAGRLSLLVGRSARNVARGLRAVGQKVLRHEARVVSRTAAVRELANKETIQRWHHGSCNTATWWALGPRSRNLRISKVAVRVLPSSRIALYCWQISTAYCCQRRLLATVRGRSLAALRFRSIPAMVRRTAIHGLRKTEWSPTRRHRNVTGHRR